MGQTSLGKKPGTRTHLAVVEIASVSQIGQHALQDTVSVVQEGTQTLAQHGLLVGDLQQTFGQQRAREGKTHSNGSKQKHTWNRSRQKEFIISRDPSSEISTTGSTAAAR